MSLTCPCPRHRMHSGFHSQPRQSARGDYMTQLRQTRATEARSTMHEALELQVDVFPLLFKPAAGLVEYGQILTPTHGTMSTNHVERIAFISQTCKKKNNYTDEITLCYCPYYHSVSSIPLHRQKASSAPVQVMQRR